MYYILYKCTILLYFLSLCQKIQNVVERKRMKEKVEIRTQTHMMLLCRRRQMKITGTCSFSKGISTCEGEILNSYSHFI